MSAARKVIVRDPEQTEMSVAGNGNAKAFARQLIRDGKGFDARPIEDGVWWFVIYETNYPNRWEAA